MSISFQVLGSSSSGNATVLSVEVDGDTRHLLLDAGLGPRTVAERLASCDLHGIEIDAIVLTHADSDHMRSSWRRTLLRHRIPVHVAASHREEAEGRGVPRELLRVFRGAFVPIPGVRFDPVRTPHDDHGSAAFRIECGSSVVGWATDLGRVDDRLLEHLSGIHALGIESNYDPGLQQASDRPGFLIERITGGRGHLSNQQCLDAVRILDDRSAGRDGLETVVLLHLSRACNCRDRVRSLWERTAPGLAGRMEISWPDRIGPRVRLGGAVSNQEQLGLFG
ncbi:MAG: MBL fold metallo-hydrolase [Planctomycetota bacterium]|nr:MBL fold metallo-hydrolase [Planctomycetota bacterium]